jgi:hypothetical protein
MIKKSGNGISGNRKVCSLLSLGMMVFEINSIRRILFYRLKYLNIIVEINLAHIWIGIGIGCLSLNDKGRDEWTYD